MQSGNLLIEHLRQLVDADFESLLSSVLPELELSEGLVAEGGRHDERGVTGGASQIEETT